MSASPLGGKTQPEPSWARVIGVAAARGVLALAASLMLWSSAPALIGWHPNLVLTDSMRPAIAAGDVIVTRPLEPSRLQVGQVLVVDDPDHPGGLRSHRLDGFNKDGSLRLRGDANPASDSSPVQPSDIQGVAVLRVPYVGLPWVWQTEHRWGRLALIAAGLILLGVLARGGWTPRGPGSRRRRRAALAAGLVAATVVSGGGSSTADAAFARVTSNTTNQLTAAPTFYPYRDSILADSPALYWRLAESVGPTAVDASGNGAAGAYSNSPAFGQAGPLVSESRDRALSTGTNGYVTSTASSIGPAIFSVEAWFKTTSTSGGRILGYGDAGAGSFSTNTDRQIYLSPGGQVLFGLSALKATIQTTAPLNDGVWHHVVGTYSALTGSRLYVDGGLVATGTAVTLVSLNGYWRAGAEALSGWPSAPTSSYFAGSLDEVAVYSTVLSASRIQAHYAAATTP